MENVWNNYKLTPWIRNKKNAKNGSYPIYDTACPVQIRNFTKNSQPYKRWPDAIGFGFGKCGTGSLAFLDCHPSIVFRKLEPSFFNDKNVKMLLNNPNDQTVNLLRQYAIPNASESEFLIEKTPMYARAFQISQIRDRIRAINKVMPNVKIFMFLCDPVERLYSHLKHCIREEYTGTSPLIYKIIIKS